MVLPEDDDEGGKYPMEKDGNRPPEPASLRMKRHTDDVAKDHRSQVEVTEQQHPPAKRRAWRDKKPVTSREVDTDFDIERDDKELGRQEVRIGHQSRVPGFHRRQPRHPDERHQHLSGYTQAERGKEQPQPRGKRLRRRHHTLSANMLR